MNSLRLQSWLASFAFLAFVASGCVGGPQPEPPLNPRPFDAGTMVSTSDASAGARDASDPREVDGGTSGLPNVIRAEAFGDQGSAPTPVGPIAPRVEFPRLDAGAGDAGPVPTTSDASPVEASVAIE